MNCFGEPLSQQFNRQQYFHQEAFTSSMIEELYLSNRWLRLCRGDEGRLQLTVSFLYPLLWQDEEAVWAAIVMQSNHTTLRFYFWVVQQTGRISEATIWYVCSTMRVRYMSESHREDLNTSAKLVNRQAFLWILTMLWKYAFSFHRF